MLQMLRIQVHIYYFTNKWKEFQQTLEIILSNA